MRVRAWKKGLSDKIQEGKYGKDRITQEIKIDQKVQKQRLKSLVGRKLHEENQKII
jgi:hypothetical protein